MPQASARRNIRASTSTVRLACEGLSLSPWCSAATSARSTFDSGSPPSAGTMWSRTMRPKVSTVAGRQLTLTWASM